MNIKRLSLCLLGAGYLLSSLSYAQATSMPHGYVMKLTEVKGIALVEMPDGHQAPAHKGANLPHGAKLMVLEKASVKGMYMQDRCEVEYNPNTVVNIRTDAQCAAGAPVINADKYAKFGTEGNAGCCVVRTVTVPVKPAPVITAAPVAAAPVTSVPVRVAPVISTASHSVNYFPYVLGGIAGIAILSELLDDDDDNDRTPVSR